MPNPHNLDRIDAPEPGVPSVTRSRLAVNAFLLRSNIESPASALTESAEGHVTFYVPQAANAAGLWAAEDDLELLEASRPGDALLALIQRPSAAPTWHGFVRKEFGLDDFDPVRGTSTGAILFTKVVDPAFGDERWLAWCFGSGSRSLRRSASDPRFGLLSALSGVSPETSANGESSSPRLRSLSHRSYAPYHRASGHRASRDIPLDAFPLDRMSDLVAAAGGKVSTPWASSLLGSRSLRFTASVSSTTDLVDLANEVMDLFRSDRYKRSYGWVDNFSLVECEELIDGLESRVTELLRGQGTLAELDVLIADDLTDLDREREIEFFRFKGRGARRSDACDKTLTLEMVRSRVRAVVGLDCLSEAVEFLDSNRQSIGSCSLLELLSGEVVFNDRTYVLYDGDFYLVDTTFLADIGKRLDAIPVSAVELPPYEGGSESSYNDLVGARSDSLLCLDRQLITVAGESSFEACDLLDVDRRFIHVKRKGRSSTLSHLFFQARVSGEMLLLEASARNKFIELARMNGRKLGIDRQTVLESSLAELEAGARAAGEWEVVFAFLGDWADRSIHDLPLFSRVALAGIAHDLQLRGFRVAYKCVDIVRDLPGDRRSSKRRAKEG